MSDRRRPAVAGSFYPGDRDELRELVGSLLAAVSDGPRPARAAMVPHAGLIYSGASAAQVFRRVRIPPLVVLLGPNHTGRWGAPGGASAWSRGAFVTPLGEVPVAQAFLERLAERSPLVAHDPAAHLSEHAIEVELPFLVTLRREVAIAPIVLAWDEWELCRSLGAALAGMVAEWPEEVLLVASSDMTHYEPAAEAERKDRAALAAVERLDGRALLETCRRRHVTMCGRAPAATVIEAARLLGGTEARVVDYRHSGWVTGDHSSVVGYAGVVVC